MPATEPEDPVDEDVLDYMKSTWFNQDSEEPKQPAQLGVQSRGIDEVISLAINASPGSPAFVEAQQAINKFVKLLPGQDEISTLTHAFDYFLDACQQHERDSAASAASQSTRRARRKASMERATDDENAIRPGPLAHVLSTHGMAVTAEEVETLFDVIDLDQNGSIDQQEFVHFGLSATMTAQRITATTGFEPGTADFRRAQRAVAKVIRVVPPHLQEHFSGHGELAAIGQWVRQWDLNHDGVISVREMLTALARLRIPISEDGETETDIDIDIDMIWYDMNRGWHGIPM